MEWRICCALMVMLMPAGVWAQAGKMAADAHPTIEVSTIRPTEPSSRRQGFDTDGQQVSIYNESVTSLVMFAYGVHAKQIVGGPALMDQRFDIHGVTDTAGEPNLQQFQEMLQKLLVERFGWAAHHATRRLPVYTITVAKGGPKLGSVKKPDAQPDQHGRGTTRGQTMLFTNNSMNDFALGMQFFLDRPVVNRTGLTGSYDFTLEWKPGIAAAPDPADFPDLFTAVQQELGLKLNAVDDTVDVLVVDKVTPPSAN